MIIIKNSYITRALSIFINIKAITIWPFIIISGESNKILENHEKIHIKQQEELLLIGFYILYVYYWIKNLFRFYGLSDLYLRAYLNIPFELEAKENEANPYYLICRKKYSWRKYV